MILTYQSLDREPARLRKAYSWLSEAQIRAALGYYAVYPAEIDRRIAQEARWTRDRLVVEHPALVVEP